MTEDPKELVARLRKGRLIKASEYINLEGIGPVPTGETRELCHPDALAAADLIERLTADRERSVGGNVRVHQVEDGYVVADGGGWLPGVYASEAMASAAASVPHDQLAAWWAAIAATPPQVPDDFVLVPKVPTEAMLEAGEAMIEKQWYRTNAVAAHAWSAMIAAAPAPALPETGVER